MLSVFANIKIEDKQRLQRFKKSFFSFKDSKIQSWSINIRGKEKNKAYQFLQKNLKSKNVFYYHLNSEKGWFSDTRKMYKTIKGCYIFFWNEDYILEKKTKIFDEIINELNQKQIDILTYGQYSTDINKLYKILKCQETKNLIYLNFDKKLRQEYYRVIKNKKLNYALTYIVSAASIIKKKLFKKIIFLNDPPIKRWSKYCPFDFEKAPYDYHFLPLIIASTKKRLFKDIDFERIGSSHYFDGKNYKLKKSYKLIFYIKKPIKFFVINIREILNYLISNYILKIKIR